jgi:tetratricopeptide (TPR) repeat protein
MDSVVRTFCRASQVALIALVFCSQGATALDTAKKAAMEAELPKLTAAIAANPNDATQYFTRACVYRVLEKWDSANQDYGMVIERKSADWTDEAYEGRGICRMHMGFYKDALSDLNFALKLNAGLFEARRNRALILYRLGYPDKALSEVTGLLSMKAYQADPVLLAYRARIRNALRDYAGAMADANAALAVDKANSEGLEERARALVGLNQSAKAITELTQLIGSSPQKGSLWGALALAHYGKKDYKQTVLTGAKATELGYSSADVLAACADSYGRLGEFQSSITTATSALGINPSSGLAYYARGNSYKHLKRPDLAKADLDKAIKLGHRGE